MGRRSNGDTYPVRPMSNPSTAGDRRGDRPREPTDDEDGVDPTLEDVTPTLAKPIRIAGFWGAIVLPILYFPVLANGLSTSLEATVFLGLVALNLLALYVGHTHRRS